MRPWKFESSRPHHFLQGPAQIRWALAFMKMCSQRAFLESGKTTTDPATRGLSVGLETEIVNALNSGECEQVQALLEQGHYVNLGSLRPLHSPSLP